MYHFTPYHVAEYKYLCLFLYSNVFVSYDHLFASSQIVLIKQCIPGILYILWKLIYVQNYYSILRVMVFSLLHILISVSFDRIINFICHRMHTVLYACNWKTTYSTDSMLLQSKALGIVVGFLWFHKSGHMYGSMYLLD